jgi:hypothetical protein
VQGDDHFTYYHDKKIIVEGLKLLHPRTKKIPLPLKSSISTLLVKFGKYDSDLTYSWLKVI